MTDTDVSHAGAADEGLEQPFGLLAELTYACPLHCPYCSNPLEMERYNDELSTEEWKRVFTEAAELGVLQLHLSGGEPMQRHDIADLVTCANELGLYTNLITSGLGFSERRAEQLRAAGLDHVQVSIQADEETLSDRIAGTRSFQRKHEVAALVKKLGWPLTLNVVLHRQNIDRIGGILEMADEVGADRIELANTQYYGWAGLNRSELLPSREQLTEAETVVRAAKERLGGRMEIIYVIPDYYSRYPKPCMDGWARRQFTVVPDGEALPCPTAHDVVRGHGLDPANVREHHLKWIWESSPVFRKFRGTDWMPEPCSSCPRRDIDFGGCRCQAFALTGDAARTDPVCHLSPDHDLVTNAVAEANDPDQPRTGELVPRPNPRRSRTGSKRDPAPAAGAGMDEATAPGQTADVARPPCHHCGEPYSQGEEARHTEPVACERCPRCRTMPACYTCRNMYCACEVHQA